MDTTRAALPGELCTCGRQAVEVFEFGDRPPIGYCRIPDGGARLDPCPFCGEPCHESVVCPQYRLRPQGTAWERHDDPGAGDR